MATSFSFLAWKSPWTEEPSGLQTMRSPRVGHDWAHTCTHTQSSTQGAGYWCFVLFIQLFNFLWWWEEGTGAVGSSKENILPPDIFPPASLTLLNLGNSPRSPWELSLHVQDIDYLQESRIQECYCICLQMRWLTAVLIRCLGRESGIRKVSSRCSWRPFICYQRKLLHMHVGEPTPSASFIKQGDHTLCCCPPKPGGLRPQFSSVAQSCLTLCDPVNCSTPGLPVHHQLWVHSNSRPSSQWRHPAISSSAVPFSSCPQSLPASESFPMSQLFAWGGQSIGASASASFLPMNTQDWSPLEWTGWMSL